MTTPQWNHTMMKAIELLVKQGRVEMTMVDGKPGIRLIKQTEKPEPPFTHAQEAP